MNGYEDLVPKGAADPYADLIPSASGNPYADLVPSKAAEAPIAPRFDIASATAGSARQPRKAPEPITRDEAAAAAARLSLTDEQLAAEINPAKPASVRGVDIAKKRDEDYLAASKFVENEKILAGLKAPSATPAPLLTETAPTDATTTGRRRPVAAVPLKAPSTVIAPLTVTTPTDATAAAVEPPKAIPETKNDAKLVERAQSLAEAVPSFAKGFTTGATAGLVNPESGTEGAPGSLGRIAGNLAGGFAAGLTGPVGAPAFLMTQFLTDLEERGMDPAKMTDPEILALAATSGLMGGATPVAFGKKLLTRALTGAGLGAAQNVAEEDIMAQITDTEPARLRAAILGGAFGAGFGAAFRDNPKVHEAVAEKLPEADVKMMDEVAADLPTTDATPAQTLKTESGLTFEAENLLKAVDEVTAKGGVVPEEVTPELSRLAAENEIPVTAETKAQDVVDALRERAGKTTTPETPAVAPEAAAQEIKKQFAGTKIVDNNGDPMVVYHGTHNDFDKFDKDWAVKNLGRNPEGIDAVGSWFTDNKDIKYGPKTKEAYLNIKKPLYFDDIKEGDAFDQLKKAVTDAGGATKYREKLVSEGYDGIVLNGTMLDGKVQNAIIALEPDQIKMVGKPEAAAATPEPATNAAPEPTILPESAPAAPAAEAPLSDRAQAQKDWLEKKTESPRFKKWFGESKVVDAEGKPMVVYHGTESAGFDEFKTPSFFSESKSEAKAYSEITDTDADRTIIYEPVGDRIIPEKVDWKESWPTYEDYTGEPNVVVSNGNTDRLFYWDGKTNAVGDKNIVILSGVRVDDKGNVVHEKTVDDEGLTPRELKRDVYPVYLNIKNPIKLPWDEANILGKRLGADDATVEKKISEWKKQGYDGIETESDDGLLFHGKHVKQFIPFDPSQVKSATRNSGRFDPTSASITDSLPGKPFGSTPEGIVRAPDADEPSLTSARKAYTSKDRADMGLDEIPSPERQSWRSALDKAADSDIEPGILAQTIIEHPRALDQVETASMVRRMVALKNQHEAALERISKIQDDPAAINEQSRALREIEKQFDEISTAVRHSGTEKGRNLAIQKLTLNKNYDLVSVLAKAKAAKGKDLTPQERSKFEDMTKKIKDQEAELEATRKKLRDVDAREAINERRRAPRRTPEVKANIAELTEKTRRLLRAGCLTG